MTTLTEADIEQSTLDWLADLGWRVVHVPGIAPDTPGSERGGYGLTVLDQWLRGAQSDLSSGLPRRRWTTPSAG